MLKEPKPISKSMPPGTAFLVSALMIYPAFSAISVDLDKQALRIDFQFSLIDNSIEVYDKLAQTVEKGLAFAHKLLGIKPNLSVISSTSTDNVYIASWERDMESLSEQEVDVLHELLLDFGEDYGIEYEDTLLDGEQFYHFEQLFDELFHRVQEMDASIRLRAYRDMGMIYVHSLPLSDKAPRG